MDENQLTVAAFAKMVLGEPVSLNDAQRVWGVILQNGTKIDTADENARNQFRSQLKGQMQKIFFSS